MSNQKYPARRSQESLRLEMKQEIMDSIPAVHRVNVRPHPCSRSTNLHQLQPCPDVYSWPG